MSLFRQRFASFSTHFLTWWFLMSTDIAWERVLMLRLTSGSQSFKKTLRTRMDTSKFICTHKSRTRHNLNILELPRHNANTGFLSSFFFSIFTEKSSCSIPKMAPQVLLLHLPWRTQVLWSGGDNILIIFQKSIILIIRNIHWPFSISLT